MDLKISPVDIISNKKVLAFRRLAQSVENVK